MRIIRIQYIISVDSGHLLIGYDFGLILVAYDQIYSWTKFSNPVSHIEGFEKYFKNASESVVVSIFFVQVFWYTDHWPKHF